LRFHIGLRESAPAPFAERNGPFVRQDGRATRSPTSISSAEGIDCGLRAFKRQEFNANGGKTMTHHGDHTHSDTEIATLNTLTATLIDSVNGYEDAASNSESSRFQQMFRECAQERNQAVEELRSEIRRLGGNPEDDGSFMGKTHQRFLDLKAAVMGRDEQAIVNEVERGEDYLKEKFETALSGDTLSGEGRTIVERVYQSVRSGHDKMSALKHGMEATN
jgi:uncharacterized protein (TIGR02284 family)